MARYLTGLKVENSAIYKRWEENSFFISENENGETHFKKSASGKLLEEAIEYFILDKLSNHLADYFRSPSSIDKAGLVTLSRNQLPQFLLSNSFLELFSKPMQDREIFGQQDDPEIGVDVYSFGKDGAIYDKFELTVPNKSRVERSDDGGVRISTRLFTMSISPVLNGFAHVTPSNFDRLYLGRKFGEISHHKVSVAINLDFTWWALFSRRGWDYHGWIDSFVESIAADFEFETFLDEISWRTCLTNYYISRNVT